MKNTIARRFFVAALCAFFFALFAVPACVCPPGYPALSTSAASTTGAGGAAPTSSTTCGTSSAGGEGGACPGTTSSSSGGSPPCDTGYGGAAPGSSYNAGPICSSRFCETGETAYGCGAAEHCPAPSASCVAARGPQHCGAGLDVPTTDCNATAWCCADPSLLAVLKPSGARHRRPITLTW